MKKLIIALVLTLFCVAAFSAMAAKPKVKTETVTYAVCQACGYRAELTRR